MIKFYVNNVESLFYINNIEICVSIIKHFYKYEKMSYFVMNFLYFKAGLKYRSKMIFTLNNY